MRWPSTSAGEGRLRGGTAFPLLAAGCRSAARPPAPRCRPAARSCCRCAARSPPSACARPSIGLALPNRRQPAGEARAIALRRRLDEPGNARRRRRHRQPATAGARRKAESAAKRGMPMPVMPRQQRQGREHSTGRCRARSASRRRAPMLRKRPMPDPSAMAPASASGPPMLGRSSTTVSGRNATPSFRISTARSPQLLQQHLPAATSELPALCAAIPATPRPARAPSRAAAPAALEPAASAAPAALICWAAACLASAMRRRRFSRRTLIGGADVLVPFEAFGLLSPAEHVRARAPGRARLTGSATAPLAREGCGRIVAAMGRRTVKPDADGNWPRFDPRLRLFANIAASCARRSTAQVALGCGHRRATPD